MFLQTVLNGIVQVLMFSLIPYIWWFISASKKESLSSWLGIKKPVFENTKKGILSIVVVFAALLCLGELAILVRGPMETADSQFKGMGAWAVPSVLAYAFIQTAMSEEILFRGFLFKRLKSKFGFTVGNAIQAVIFGLIHLLMVWGDTSFLSGLMIVVYPTVVAVTLAYVNEKLANGSILPGWILHGLLNTVQGIMAACL